MTHAAGLDIDDPLDRLRKGRVLIVSATGGGSRRYRCDHRVEQLGIAGVEATVVSTDEWDPVRASASYDFFILHRVGWRQRLPHFLADACRRRKPTLYEADDLLFDPTAAELRSLPPEQALDDVREKHRLQQMTLERCGGATVSTTFLEACAAAYNPHLLLVPNVVTRKMVEAGAAAGATATRSEGAVTIGYFSGTPTHDRDFAEAADAVLETFEARPSVRLLVVGPLRLDERFERFGARIQRAERRPWNELPALLASVDVNLAPLESGNRFAAGKSCVKFLEAALVGLPTIASPVPDFERVIAHGDSGMIARSPREWREALEALVDDAALRRRIGEAAADHVRRFETTDARAEELSRTLAGLFQRTRPSVARAGIEASRAAARRARRALSPLLPRR